MNRLRLYTIKLIAETNPHIFKTRDGQLDFYDAIDWINLRIQQIRKELVDTAYVARAFVRVDKYPRSFDLHSNFPPRMMSQTLINIVGQFLEFERFYTFEMRRLNKILARSKDKHFVAPSKATSDDNDPLIAINAVYNDIEQLVEDTRKQVDQFDSSVKVIKEHASVRYRLITAYNKPFNSRLTQIFNQIQSFERSFAFEPYLTRNDANDIYLAHADRKRISDEAHHALQQTEPQNDSGAETQFDRFAKLVKEFNLLCNEEEKKYSEKMRDTVDPSASGLKPALGNLAELAKLLEAFKSLRNANLEQGFLELSFTLSIANMAQVVIEICAVLKAQHNKGVDVFADFNDVLLCEQAAKYGFADALLRQDLNKIETFLSWIVKTVPSAVESRYYSGRRFQPITSEQMPREYATLNPAQSSPEDTNDCLAHLELINQRIAALITWNVVLDNNHAPRSEKTQAGAALIFCFAKAGLLVRKITLAHGLFPVIPREYSIEVQEFIAEFNPTQCQSFFAACNSHRTTPLFSYLERTYCLEGGKDHSLMLIDRLTKIDMEILLQELVQLATCPPSNEWAKMDPHVRSILTHLAKQHLYLHTEFGPSLLNNQAQTLLVNTTPLEARRVLFNLDQFMPTFVIGHFDEFNMNVIQYFRGVLLDLSNSLFKNVFIDVHSALGPEGVNLLRFRKRYAITHEQQMVIDDVYQLMVNILSWKSFADVPALEPVSLQI